MSNYGGKDCVPSGAKHFRPSNSPKTLTRQLTNHSLCVSRRDLEQLFKEDQILCSKQALLQPVTVRNTIHKKPQKCLIFGPRKVSHKNCVQVRPIILITVL